MTLDTKQELVISQNIGGQLQVSANVNKPKKTDTKNILLYKPFPCIHTYTYFRYIQSGLVKLGAKESFLSRKSWRKYLKMKNAC